jgi:hypothetical protein
MAAVNYSAGKIREYISGETKLVYWESPATMDSADTVTVPAITGKSVRMISAWDHTTGDAITATVSTATITLDAAGSTTDHIYSIVFTYV